MTRHSKEHSAKELPIVAYLRRSPGTRGAAYLVVGATVFELVGHVLQRRQQLTIERLHLTLVPITAAITYAFSRLDPQSTQDVTSASGRARLAEALGGAALGAGGILALLGAAASQSWVDAPHWGWETVSPPELAKSVAELAVGHLAVAWDEETVFRGYSYTTLRQALPPGVAETILTLLFAFAHEWKVQVFVGEAMLGIPLMLLRIATGDIWASVGYHWAWNFVQTGVFGPAQHKPSLRPLNLHGPYVWTGKPGLPEPGLLSMATNLLVSAGIALWMRGRRRANQR